MRSFPSSVRGCALLGVAALFLMAALPARAQLIRPVATLEPGISGVSISEKVASIGDYDGDGTPDIVGFTTQSVDGTKLLGVVYSGRTFEVLSVFSHGGRTVDVGYDVTGDGVREIAVGVQSGAYVLDGKTGALRTPLMWPRHTTGDYGWRVVSIKNAVRGATDDYVVAHPSGTFYGRPPGILYVFDGANGDTSLYQPSRPPYDKEEGGTGGFPELFSLGDFDRDGFGDFAVGSPIDYAEGDKETWGRVFVFSGATGQAGYTIANPDTARRGGTGFGSNLLVVSDINGDGYGELIIASTLVCSYAKRSGGCLYRYDGRTAAILDTLVHPQNDVGGEFGASLVEIGDVDGDGVPELVVGAPGSDNQRPDAGFWPRDSGLVFIYSGRTLKLLYRLESPNKPTSIYAHFGRSVANAGDLDGDGLDEILVGEPGKGHIHVFNLARPTGVADEAAPQQQQVSISPNPARDAASVRVVLAQGGPVEAVLYDVLGREVRRVVDAVVPPGTHTAYVDVRGLASGRYALRLTTGAAVTTHLLTVAR